MKYLLLAFFLAGAPAISAQECPPLQNPNNRFSIGEEIAYGQNLAREYESQYRLLDAPQINSYLLSIINGLEATGPSCSRTFQYNVRIIVADEINAASASGGTIFVTTGLLKNVESEDALAGTLAHEMGHISLRHATTWQTMDERSAAALSAFFAAYNQEKSAEKRRELYARMHDFQNLFDPLTMGLTERQEREADAFAMRLCLAAGYNPRAYERLVAAQLLDFNFIVTNSHDLPSLRAQFVALQREIQAADSMPQKPAPRENATFASMKEYIRNLK